jgi:hypothetical protein
MRSVFTNDSSSREFLSIEPYRHRARLGAPQRRQDGDVPIVVRYEPQAVPIRGLEGGDRVVARHPAMQVAGEHVESIETRTPVRGEVGFLEGARAQDQRKDGRRTRTADDQDLSHHARRSLLFDGT